MVECCVYATKVESSILLALIASIIGIAWVCKALSSSLYMRHSIIGIARVCKALSAGSSPVGAFDSNLNY